MIVLDTNIVSEFMGGPAHPRVEAWLRTLLISEIYLTSLQTAEILYGLEALPEGRRQAGLLRDYRAFRGQLPAGNCLAFDEAAAKQYAFVQSQRKAMGRPIKVLDAQIASVCLAHGFDLATRNTKDFEGLGLPLINPFEHET
ncbi:MAG: type II toxin-antitoxin system VapC family toxin [Hyphomonadaceae bacterium]|nr:type II toxin-antitoxin system VapC family toxin [Hyphomonadaceae bacterium]